MEFFKLKEKPFSLTPDIDFFCDFDQYQDLLSGLTSNVRSGEGLVVITAEVGHGKTMICRKFLHLLEDMGNIVNVYIPNPKLEPSALLLTIAEQLNLEVEDTQLDQITNLINIGLIELAREGNQTICVIDEAQVMSAETIETLRLLTNLETQKRKLLQIVLFAQPELMNLLNRESLRQIRQRISYHYTIPPLSFSDCYKYVCRRLIVAGHPDGMVLSKTAHHQLYKHSRGIPRIINILLDKALMLAATKSKKQINANMIEKTMNKSSNLVIKTSSNFDELFLIAIIIIILMISGFLIYTNFGGF